MKWFKRKWLWLFINLLAILPLASLIGLMEISFSTLEFIVHYPEGLLENPGLKGKDISPFWFPIHLTGEWAIRWLVFSLLCTPLNILFAWKKILKVKKLTGLWAFAYSLIHLLFFISDSGVLATFGELNTILGFVSFLIMLVLALTSNKDSHQWLKKSWKKLHRYVYAAGVLAVFHVVLLNKGWELYGILLGFGFIIRMPVVKTFILKLRRMKNVNEVKLAN